MKLLPDKISTLEMECAIMNYFGVRQNIVVPNVFWSFFIHEVDILSLSLSNYATEVEIKVSKSDLLADAKKKHNHESTLIKYLYFAVPDYLAEFALEHIPKRAGLFSVSRSVTGYRTLDAEKNDIARKWSEKQVYDLLRVGVMRILGLKKKVLKYKEGERE